MDFKREQPKKSTNLNPAVESREDDAVQEQNSIQDVTDLWIGDGSWGAHTGELTISKMDFGVYKKQNCQQKVDDNPFKKDFLESLSFWLGNLILQLMQITRQLGFMLLWLTVGDDLHTEI